MITSCDVKAACPAESERRASSTQVAKAVQQSLSPLPSRARRFWVHSQSQRLCPSATCGPSSAAGTQTPHRPQPGSDRQGQAPAVRNGGMSGDQSQRHCPNVGGSTPTSACMRGGSADACTSFHCMYLNLALVLGHAALALLLIVADIAGSTHFGR